MDRQQAGSVPLPDCARLFHRFAGHVRRRSASKALVQEAKKIHQVGAFVNIIFN